MENTAPIYDRSGRYNQNGEPTQVSIPFPELVHILKCIYLKNARLYHIALRVGLQITQAHLQKPSKKGGLGLPVFKHYYWAANSRALTHWKCENVKAEENPLWLQLEAAEVEMSLLHALLFSDSAPLSKLIQQNFTVKNSLQILN